MIKGLPMLTHAFLKWIVEQDTKNKTMLEFGSGASTLFFSNIFKNVKSFECNEKYRLSLEKEMPKNVELYDLNFNLFPQILKDVDYVLIDNNVGPGSTANATLSEAQLASHSHVATFKQNQNSNPWANGFNPFGSSTRVSPNDSNQNFLKNTGSGTGHSHNMSATFSGDATSVVQPYLTIIYIIKT